MSERIVSAAVMHRGLPHTVPAPGRHHHVLAVLRDKFPCDVPWFGEQGFMTDSGRFVDRNEAAVIAVAAGQIIPAPHQGNGPVTHLFSEDLW